MTSNSTEIVGNGSSSSSSSSGSNSGAVGMTRSLLEDGEVASYPSNHNHHNHGNNHNNYTMENRGAIPSYDANYTNRPYSSHNNDDGRIFPLTLPTSSSSGVRDPYATYPSSSSSAGAAGGGGYPMPSSSSASGVSEGYYYGVDPYASTFPAYNGYPIHPPSLPMYQPTGIYYPQESHHPLGGFHPQLPVLHNPPLPTNLPHPPPLPSNPPPRHDPFLRVQAGPISYAVASATDPSSHAVAQSLHLHPTAAYLQQGFPAGPTRSNCLSSAQSTSTSTGTGASTSAGTGSDAGAGAEDTRNASSCNAGAETLSRVYDGSSSSSSSSSGATSSSVHPKAKRAKAVKGKCFYCHSKKGKSTFRDIVALRHHTKVCC